MSNSLTIEPRKKVPGYLKAKRRLQHDHGKVARTIAKELRVPFAVDARAAARIAWRRREVSDRRTEAPPTFRRTPFATTRVWRPDAVTQRLQAA
jgi:hypothetical protein